ncbi:YbhB/YbcL family Raf kinase inhibitor-like protein [Paracoccus sp. YIM 132242]|uniref:YbhB/YbcL family Raf kinase inhibitor-like protein n=1 Tax=Paracoccus lichenicola TaxID=2665644 RepID=A0A6L6HQ63_9RHOB|nr:YbhB/YbcL family Raf kinase inhibitor-like protein [Paracoccus lichenicola]MTE01286.1 YbhB/YbcL family Raf kinase inhibitor-like protein [Paracoccus lichenicola]
MPRILVLTIPAAALAATSALAQPEGKVGQYSDATVTGAILEPQPRTPDADLSGFRLPPGATASVFAKDLVNPRILAVSAEGTLYATRRSVGDVVMLRDGDGDGQADAPVTVASRPGMHGIAFDGNLVYLVTVNDVYVADVAEDGTFGPLRRIIDDLPDGGQHPNRTLAMGPDGKLYVSVGSTCNACAETNPESATILRTEPDGTSRTIFAGGLRNTIGFDWEPETGQLWGMDHGIDWLGDNEQIEELNRIRQGKQYGWPYVHGMDRFNPQDNPPPGTSLETWAKISEEPALGHTAHAAPMQMAFYDGAMFPEWRGDALVAMRGSWNRRPPSGYELVRIDFQDGKPVGIEPVMTGFLAEGAEGWTHAGRPVGVAVGRDGAVFVSDDTQGVIYRIASEAAPQDRPPAGGPVPNALVPPPPSPLATEVLKAPAGLTVTAPFQPDAPIDPKHAADGDNASPALSWDGAPEGTRSFVIIAEDPDAREPKPFVHWLAYDIPASVTALREGLPTEPSLPDPEGVKQGANAMGSTGYTGPKPPVPDGPHHYHFQVFALDLPSLDLPPAADRAAVLAAMQGHVLAAGTVTGTFDRNQGTLP